MFGILYDLSHAIQHKKAIGPLSTKQKSDRVLEYKTKKAIRSLGWPARAPGRRRRGEPSPARGVAATLRRHAQRAASMRLLTPGGRAAPQRADRRSRAPRRRAAARRRLCCSAGGERLRERRHCLRLLGQRWRARPATGTGQSTEHRGGGELAVEAEASVRGRMGAHLERGRDPSRTSGPDAGAGGLFPDGLGRAQLGSSI
jgi:hypothetical protein